MQAMLLFHNTKTPYWKTMTVWRSMVALMTTSPKQALLLVNMERIRVKVWISHNPHLYNRGENIWKNMYHNLFWNGYKMNWINAIDFVLGSIEWTSKGIKNILQVKRYHKTLKRKTDFVMKWSIISTKIEPIKLSRSSFWKFWI